MKTSNRLFQVLAVIPSSGISTNNTKTIHYITLKVETDIITSQNVLDACKFSSDSPNKETMISQGNLEDFNLSVDAGDFIIWRGVSSSDAMKDVVNITSINHHGGARIFGKNIIKGNDQSPELVVAMVPAGTNGKVEKYTIKFDVFNDGNRRGGTFHIDPKITVKP